MNKEDKSLVRLFDVWHFNFLNYQLKIIPLHLLLYSFLCKLKDTSLKIKKKKNNGKGMFILSFIIFSYLEIEKKENTLV